MKNRMLKKRICAFLIVVFSFLLYFCISACNNHDEVKAPMLYGFDIVETIEVKYGTETHAQSGLFVTDNEGSIYEVTVTVLDSTGAKIQTDEGETFFAKDKNGYTIIYNITTFDFSVEKRTTVTVIEAE